MRIKTYLILVGAIFLTGVTPTANAADIWVTHFFTNATVVANSRLLFSAIQAGDAKGRVDVKALLGLPVAFVGEARYSGGGTNIIVRSNIVLNVELQPIRFVGVPGAFSKVEVMGKLKGVDFEKRVIFILAKPADYRVDLTL